MSNPKRVFNFNPGPATLPLEVLETAQAELLDFKGTGMSVMEISHRSKEFEAVIQTAEADLRELLGIPPGIETMALIPLGWPVDRHGATKRRPAEEVAFWDRWGAVRPRSYSNSSRTPG